MRCDYVTESYLNSQESEDGGGDSGRLVSGPSVVSASSYDSGASAAVSQSKSGSIKVDEGDDVRVACAMIVRKQVRNISSIVTGSILAPSQTLNVLHFFIIILSSAYSY